MKIKMEVEQRITQLDLKITNLINNIDQYPKIIKPKYTVTHSNLRDLQYNIPTNDLQKIGIVSYQSIKQYFDTVGLNLLDEKQINQIYDQLTQVQDRTQPAIINLQINAEKKELENQIEQLLLTHPDFLKYTKRIIKELSFEIERKVFLDCTKEISQQIVQSISEHLNFINQSTSQLIVVCAGGMGGSIEFKDAVKNIKIFGTPDEICSGKNIIEINEQVAQKSISQGGVFLAEEKDHASCPYVQTVVNHQVEQTLKGFDKNLAIRWLFKEFSLFQSKSAFFDFISGGQQLDSSSFGSNKIYCSAGWNGIKIFIFRHQFKDKEDRNCLQLQWGLNNNVKLKNTQLKLCQLIMNANNKILREISVPCISFKLDELNNCESYEDPQHFVKQKQYMCELQTQSMKQREQYYELQIATNLYIIGDELKSSTKSICTKFYVMQIDK